MASDIIIPISPIHGMVNTPGDATHGPFIQLLNPTASGFNLRVYEIRIGATKPTGTSRLRMARRSAPLTLGGAIVTALVERRNSLDATAIVATLKGCAAVVGTIPTEAQSFWFDRITADGSTPYSEVPIIVPMAFPITVVPGSAIEFFDPDAAAGNLARMYAVWDEIAQ